MAETDSSKVALRENISYGVVEELAALLGETQRKRPLILFVGAGLTTYLSEQLRSPCPGGWVSWGQLAQKLHDSQFGTTPGSVTSSTLGFATEYSGPENMIGVIKELHIGVEFFREVGRLFWTDPKQASIASLISEMRSGESADRWNHVSRLVNLCDAVITTNFDPVLQFVCEPNEDLPRAWKPPLFCPWYQPIRAETLRTMMQAQDSSRILMHLHGGIPKDKNDDLQSCIEQSSGFMLDYQNYVSGYPPIEVLPPEHLDSPDGYMARPRFLYELSQGCDLLYIGYSLSDYPIRTAVTYGLMRTAPAPNIRPTRCHYAILNRSVKNPEGNLVLPASYLPGPVRDAMSAQFLIRAIYLEEVAHSADSALADTRDDPAQSLVLPPSSHSLSRGLDEVFKDLFAWLDGPQHIQRNSEMDDLIVAETTNE